MRSGNQMVAGVTSEQIAKRPTEALLAWQKSLKIGLSQVSKTGFRTHKKQKVRKKIL